MTPWLLHVDVDQFLAAVEVRRRPELRGVPLIVGGGADPTQPRVVVMCASYEARAHGVRAGMPLRLARARCRDAVFLAADAAACDEASAQVMDVLRRHGPVEALGWDEAFVGVDAPDPLPVARAVRAAVLDATGLACSVGVGETRQRAKSATSFAKPGRGDGVAALLGDAWLATMGPRPVDALWGVGARIAARLAAVGVRTVADLAAADPDELARHFGPAIGPGLRATGAGTDGGELVTGPREAKSRSTQRTFPRDLTDAADVERELRALARALGAEVTGSGRAVRRVHVTVRTSVFDTTSLATTLPEPSHDAAAVEHTAVAVLARFPLDRPVRLLGVRVEFAPISAAPGVSGGHSG